MNKEKKSIDGLVVRRPSTSATSRSVGDIPKKTAKKPAAKSVATTKIKQKKTATEDFLKPVETFDFDFTSEDIKPKKHKKKAKQKWSKRKKALVITFSVLFVLTAVLLIWGDAIISKLTGGNSGVFDAISSLWNDVPLKTDVNGRTNILAFGTSGYNMEGDEGNGKHDGAQLTDSIMVISLDQETKDVAMINLPRDLKVSSACSAGKINEVYWCNNKDGSNDKAGAEALAGTIKEVLDIDIQYYTHVDWGSLVQIVDSIGGITVTLDEDINDYMTKTYIKAGVPTVLNGGQALGLARARHGTTGGDFSRGNSQQKILIALAQKFKDNEINLTEALGLVNALGDNLRTDFNADEIKTMVNLFSDFDLNNMRQIPLVDYENNVYYVTTASIGGISYVVPAKGAGQYGEIQEYVKRMINSNPAVREGANIMVLNGSDTVGLAGAEKEKLVNDGYKIGYIGDADGKYSGYQLYVINGVMNATKVALEERYGVQAQTTDHLPEVVYADGYDFIIILGNTENKEN